MKRFFTLFLASVFILSSCSDTEDDEPVMTIKELRAKEKKEMSASFQKLIREREKKLKDSMILYLKNLPTPAKWYSSDRLGLPPGTVVDFKPSDMDPKYKGKYYIMVRSETGEVLINESSYKIWWILGRGDVIK